MTGAGIRAPAYGRSIALITVAGALLRVLLATRQGIGFDEDFTAVAVSHPIGETLRIVSRDSAPPLFYLLEHVAAGFGSEPWNLRLVPIAAGITLIPLLAALGRRVAGDAAGLWTAAFVAALPATLITSANARMYGLAGTLVVAAALLLWRAIERPGARRWIAFAAAAAAAVWSDYFSVLALAGVLVAAAWLRPSRRVYAIACLAFAAAVASVLPWLVYAGDQLNHAGQGFWVPPLSLTGLAGTAGQLFAGPESKAELPLRNLLLALQVAAAVAGWLALAGLVVRRRKLSEESSRATAFCLIGCGGVVALAAVSLWRPLLEARYAGVMWLPLIALAGVGLAAVPRRLAAVLLVTLAIPSLALGTAITHPETESLLPGVEARVGTHDLVAADPNHYLAVLAQGGPRTIARLHLLAESDPPWYFGTAAYPPGAVIHSVPAEVAADRGLVFWVADPGAAPPPLPAGYRQSDRRCAVLVCLTIYAPGG